MQSAPGSTTSLAGVYFAMGSSGQRPRSLSLLSAFRGNSFGYGDLTTHRGPSDHREVSRGVRHARRGPSDPRSLLRSPEDALGPTEPSCAPTRCRGGQDRQSSRHRPPARP